jgi:hypothetical protein
VPAVRSAALGWGMDIVGIYRNVIDLQTRDHTPHALPSGRSGDITARV